MVKNASDHAFCRHRAPNATFRHSRCRPQISTTGSVHRESPYNKPILSKLTGMYGNYMAYVLAFKRGKHYVTYGHSASW